MFFISHQRLENSSFGMLWLRFMVLLTLTDIKTETFNLRLLLLARNCPHNILFSDHGTHVVNEIRYMPLIISL